MNKSNLIKKIVLCSLVVFYDIVSLFWCYALIKNLIFEVSTVKIGLNGIDIIGGADIPTLIYKMGNVLRYVFPILFVVLSLGTAILLTVSAFKKQTNRKLSILLCVLSALTLVVFMLIPANAYVVTLYALVREILFIRCSQIFYIIISVAVIITNILFVKKGRIER